MSLIYQSLAKLRSNASGSAEQQPVDIPHRSRFARKSRFFAPRVLVLTALVFVAGVGASYGIYQMQFEEMETTGENTMQRVIAPAVSSPDQEMAAGGADSGVSDPSAPVVRPRKETTPSPKALVGEHQPLRNPNASEIVVAQTETAGPPAVAANAAANDPAAGIASKTGRRAVGRRKASRHHAQTAVADVERIRRANMRRSLDISRLIAEIQQSMQASDHRRTEELLVQLTRRKGRDDPYVLKLKSYWHTQQGDLNRASALLQQVLRRKPDDLEAGINMAILEIKTGRIRQADKRLSRLREIYPEDTRIPALMEKLKS